MSFWKPDPTKQYGFVGVVISVEDLSVALVGAGAATAVAAVV